MPQHPALINCAPPGTRTPNPRIMSPILVVSASRLWCRLVTSTTTTTAFDCGPRTALCRLVLAHARTIDHTWITQRASIAAPLPWRPPDNTAGGAPAHSVGQSTTLLRLGLGLGCS